MAESVALTNKLNVCAPGNIPSITTSKDIKLLTWNIDGLDDTHLMERTQYIVDLIYDYTPDIIFLQEVISISHKLLYSQLQVLYNIIPAADPPHMYYNVIFYKKDTLTLSKNPSTVQFMDSNMGRHYIHSEFKVNETTLTLNVINSHLESTKDPIPSEIRRKQLTIINDVISNFTNPCIFGGDLNLRDHEVIKVNLSPTLVDVWNACGKPENHRYTWDTSENNNLGANFTARLRFDRLYLHTPVPSAGISNAILQPCSFQLVGKERLPSGHFASDHWGILAEFRHLSL